MRTLACWMILALGCGLAAMPVLDVTDIPAQYRDTLVVTASFTPQYEVLVEWELTGGGPYTDITSAIYMVHEEELNCPDMWTLMAETTQYSYILSGWIPEYLIVVWASNYTSVSEIGYTGAPQPPSDPPQELTVTQPCADSLHLVWQEPTGPPYPPTSYRIWAVPPEHVAEFFWWTLLTECDTTASCLPYTVTQPTQFGVTARYGVHDSDPAISCVFYPVGVPGNVEAPAMATLCCSPNPFNPTTEVRFGLAQAGKMRLDVYNLLGQRVATLAQGEMPVGEHCVAWDASNLASGVYLLRLRADGNSATRRVLLLK